MKTLGRLHVPYIWIIAKIIWTTKGGGMVTLKLFGDVEVSSLNHAIGSA